MLSQPHSRPCPKYALLKFSIILILALMGCTNTDTSQPLPVASPLSDPTMTNLSRRLSVVRTNNTDIDDILIETNNKVLIKRDGWKDYYPAGYGTVVRYGDLIKTVGGTAKILCNASVVLQVDNLGGDPCPVLPILNIDNQPVLAPEVKYDSLDGSLFYVMQKQTIATQHDISIIIIIDTSLSMATNSQNNVDRTEMLKFFIKNLSFDNATPASNTNFNIKFSEEPYISTPHEIGISQRKYKFELNNEFLKNSEDYVIFKFNNPIFRDLNFQSPGELGPQNLKNNEMLISKLMNLVNQNKMESALLVIEELIQQTTSAPIYRWYGDILYSQKLMDRAEKAYKKSIVLSQADGDLETEAIDHIMLWQIHQDKAELLKAKDLYLMIGDNGTATLIDALIR